MDNVYFLSDAELVTRISAKLKELRLKQNISRQDLSAKSGVSISSVVRMEDGEIKSFDSFLRILRTLGKIDILLPLMQEEEISPNEYYRMVHSTKSNQRRRASRKKSGSDKKQEDPEW